MTERTTGYKKRLITGAVLAGLACALAGCGGGGANTFDPTDWLDFLDQKKPLPGNRKPVFPEGVPGVEQGIPKELYKDNVEREQREAVAPPPAVEPEAKPKARRGGTPAAAATPAEGESGAAEASPPKKHVAKRKRITTPPPDEAPPQPAQEAPPQAAAPAAQPQQSVSPFPAPLPSGSFSR